jgi:hypothetical protein
MEPMAIPISNRSGQNFNILLIVGKGKIVRTKDVHGHDIELEVALNQARIQDLLRVGDRTQPPVMSGEVEMNCRLSLAPGERASRTGCI